VVVAHEDRPHHAEGGDLGERDVHENDLALDDVHAERPGSRDGEAGQDRQALDIEQLLE
jgi:hypothetical protein